MYVNPGIGEGSILILQQAIKLYHSLKIEFTQYVDMYIANMVATLLIHCNELLIIGFVNVNETSNV